MLRIKDDGWNQILGSEYEKEYYKKLEEFVEHEYEEATVYPPKDMIFSAFDSINYDEVKVVIIGQDPYHTPGYAHGMSFSVLPEIRGTKLPPSLKNIYKELEAETAELSPDKQFHKPETGYLMNWAKQGVLLINTVLTVREGEPNSHKKHGWEKFTDAVIRSFNEHEEPVVFLLWGKPSEKKAELITNTKHLVLTAAHPSPLSANRGFFGCNHFIKANEFLVSKGLSEIDWRLEV